MHGYEDCFDYNASLEQVTFPIGWVWTEKAEDFEVRPVTDEELVCQDGSI